jgi:hypothetical protein
MMRMYLYMSPNGTILFNANPDMPESAWGRCIGYTFLNLHTEDGAEIKPM